MSESRRPVRAPDWARAMATLTLTVVLPTPPLPALTATMLRTPGMSLRPGSPRVVVTFESQDTSTRSTPLRGTRACSMSFWMRSLRGQAGVVSTTFMETVPRSSTCRSRTMLRLIRSRWSSGSITVLSAASMRCTSWGSLIDKGVYRPLRSKPPEAVATRPGRRMAARMATLATSEAPRRRTPVLRLGARSWPVVLPSLGDPRLHVALVIGSVQVLGQVALGFELSVAQILVCLGVCAAIEVGAALWRDHVLLWPASALLTGNSVALIMRTAGTRHGDWWSLQGIEVFVAACVVSMLSKLLLRRGGRHVFNPSNLGLVAAFTLFGTQRANPQDLWWGPLSPGLWVTLAVIVCGGLVIARRLRVLGLVAGFWVAFAACVGVVAASGHCIAARWHVGAVCGEDYWSAMAASPEVLVFAFFMITD